MKHTLAVLVRNRPGVLAHVAGLFSRRGFNIESLAVGETEDKKVSRITIVVDGADNILEQISKQLYKLIDVIKVLDLAERDAVNRELVLIKVSASPANRSEIMQIVDIFRARIVDVAEKSLIIEITGNHAKVEALEKLLVKFGIKEMVRTGKIAIARGFNPTKS